MMSDSSRRSKPNLGNLTFQRPATEDLRIPSPSDLADRLRGGPCAPLRTELQDLRTQIAAAEALLAAQQPPEQHQANAIALGKLYEQLNWTYQRWYECEFASTLVTPDRHDPT